MRPRNYVLIQATEEGSRFPAEIVRVIDCEYEKFYKKNDLWPTPYDIPGYVERLAEQLQRAKAEMVRIEPKPKKEKKKIEEKPTELCIKCNIKNGQIFGKGKCKCVKKSELVVKIPTKRELLCKRVCKSDKACLADSPIFPDDDGSLIFDEPCGCVTRSTNTQRTITLGTNTKRGTNISPGTKLKACDGLSVSCGPSYCNVTVGRKQLPELFGTCTPWQMTKKERKKLLA